MSPMVTFSAGTVPMALQRLPHWVCWQPVERNGKITKIPIDAKTGRAAKADTPSTWSTFAQAVHAARRHGWGIGYVFNDDAPFSGLDLDHVRDPITGVIAAAARTIISVVRSYGEISPSGTGVKVYFEGKIPGGKGRRRGNIELYSTKRFFCVTGQRLADSPIEPQPRQRELDWLLAQLFPPVEQRQRATVGVVSLADEDVLARARRARNGDRFQRLWNGCWETAGYSSASEADLALASMLSFWVGGDAGRVDILFRRSALCRPKWTDRDDYREWTLAKATQGDIYDARRVA